MEKHGVGGNGQTQQQQIRCRIGPWQIILVPFIFALFVIIIGMEMIQHQMQQQHKQRGGPWSPVLESPIFSPFLKWTKHMSGDRNVHKDDKNTTNPSALRVLYIVTSLSEYNTGGRATEKGSDRLKQTLIPIVSEGVFSLISPPFSYQVDVFIISHWIMRPERLALIRNALPPQVGLEYWDDATPLGYVLERNTSVVDNITRALSRQHRFVIKDKLRHYDFFCNFEDDMLIKGHHIQHNLNVTARLRRLWSRAPNMTAGNFNRLQRHDHFYQTLNQPQLSRMFSGIIRVEVLWDESKYGTQKTLDPIPVDLQGVPGLDATYCCHVRNQTATKTLLAQPNAEKLFIWETGIVALGVRKMPDFGWTLIQRGSNPGKLDREQIIGDYWSGRTKADKEALSKANVTQRPYSTELRYISNMGGWMASRQQLLHWHFDECPGSGLLPPFEEPIFALDGLDQRNVEYWSGGLQLVTARDGCNLQRIVPLQDFSKHLLYHTSNNKQKALQWKRERFVRAHHLLGQLNHVSKMAQQAMQKEEELAKKKEKQQQQGSTST